MDSNVASRLAAAAERYLQALTDAGDADGYSCTRGVGSRAAW
jgi:hypothetical protein